MTTTALVEFIENNLASKLPAELLAKQGGVSHATLYRDFYNITGHSVTEYIRKRRLSNALALIKTSDLPLAAISYDCGYSSQQALNRTVQSEVGMTPLIYKDSDEYYFFPPFDGHALHSVNVSTATIPSSLCLRFYHTGLVGIENRAIGHFFTCIPNFDGRIFGRNGKQRGSVFCYELFITDYHDKLDALKSSEFEISQEIPEFSHMFAVTSVKNNEAKINDAWDYLYSRWLSDSMFEHADEPYFEEYILKNGVPVRLKLFLPIRRRMGHIRITLEHNPQLRFVAARATGYDAERRSSEKVISYLTEHYPHILKISREFVMHRHGNICLNGVRITSPLNLGRGIPVRELYLGNNDWLVLHSDVMGDYERYRDMLLKFAHDNGMNAAKDCVYAVYNVKDGYETPKIKVYCKVKIETK